MRARKFFILGAIGLSLALFLVLLSVLPARLDDDPKKDSDPGFYRPATLPGLGYEHVPSMSGRLNGVAVRINSAGFRGPEIPEPKPAGTTRVVVLGDSFVFGQGVEEAEALPARLAQLLRASIPDRRLEVINAGVRAYNMPHYLILFENRILPLEPDLLVLVITEINDPEQTPFVPRSEKLERWKNSWWARLPFVKPFLAPAYAKEINRLFVEYVREIYDPAGQHWPLFRQELEQMRELCRQRGIPVVAVIFPVLNDPELLIPEREQLKNLLTELKIPFVDPRPQLFVHPTRKLVVDRRDFHPNALALNIVAELLAGPVAEALKKRGP